MFGLCVGCQNECKLDFLDLHNNNEQQTLCNQLFASTGNVKDEGSNLTWFIPFCLYIGAFN